MKSGGGGIAVITPARLRRRRHSPFSLGERGRGIEVLPAYPGAPKRTRKAPNPVKNTKGVKDKSHVTHGQKKHAPQAKKPTPTWPTIDRHQPRPKQDVLKPVQQIDRKKYRPSKPHEPKTRAWGLGLFGSPGGQGLGDDLDRARKQINFDYKGFSDTMDIIAVAFIQPEFEPEVKTIDDLVGQLSKMKDQVKEIKEVAEDEKQRKEAKEMKELEEKVDKAKEAVEKKKEEMLEKERAARKSGEKASIRVARTDKKEFGGTSVKYTDEFDRMLDTANLMKNYQDTLRKLGIPRNQQKDYIKTLENSLRDYHRRHSK